MRIALFLTCFNDTLFPDTGRAVVRLLERLGHEVSFPLEQTCCGQMHANSGYQLEAVPLVRRFVRVFGEEEMLLCLEDLRAAIDARPCGQLARRLVPEYAGSLPAGTLPAVLGQLR